jgi:hypothetical protein
MVYQCGLRLTERFKSGGPSLGRSPGAHKQRRPVNQKQIQIFGEIGSTQFLEQGFVPCSFFLVEQGLVLLSQKVAFWELGIFDNFGRFVFRHEELRWITQ